MHDIHETRNRGRKIGNVVESRLLASSIYQKLEINESLSSLHCRSHRHLHNPISSARTTPPQPQL